MFHTLLITFIVSNCVYNMLQHPFHSYDSMVCALIDELPVYGANEPFVKCLSKANVVMGVILFYY